MQLLRRARGILLSPRQEWDAVAAETPRIAALFLAYVLPLTALRCCVSIAEHAIAGNPLFGLLIGLAGIGLMFIVVLLCAVTAHFVAAAFGTVRPFARAVQLAATAMTPVFIGNALQSTPVIGEFLAFAGALYACSLLYTGVSVTLGVGEGRAGAFTLVVIVVLIVALGVLSFLLAGVLTMLLS